MRAYRELEARFGRLGALGEAIAVLNWDQSAMMPPGGAEARSEQLATLRVMAHEALTATDMGDLLAAAEQESAALGPWQAANLREMRRRWRHAAAVPADLVAALSRARSASEAIWRKARLANDFVAALPGLERVLSLTREAAAAKASAFNTSPYEALLDQYEPGGSTALIDRLFDTLAGYLPDLLDAVLARQEVQAPVSEPAGPFPIPAQRRAAQILMERIGFDFDHGRIDESAHPFCGGTPDDVRLTTRYDERDFAGALMGALHETGHALYQRGLPAEWRRQPVGSARGMAMHESQSLLLEMQVCRSRAFAEFAVPLLREVFNGTGPAWDADAFYRRQIAVRRGFIRVDADEMTYPAHVILRYRLEQAMIAGDLLPGDLPRAWAEEMRRLLGIVPDSDREGCLQDIHWYDGAWGYFPTYTLGALIAAQLFAAAREAIPNIDDLIVTGEFAPLLRWLRENIHAKGSSLSTEELVVAATDRPLTADVFCHHLRARYLAMH